MAMVFVEVSQNSTSLVGSKANNFLNLYLIYAMTSH